MIDDELGKAIDDIDWFRLAKVFRPPDILEYGIFGGLYFFAAMFIEFQRFYDLFVSFMQNFLVMKCDVLTISEFRTYQIHLSTAKL